MNGFAALKLGQGKHGVNDLTTAHVTMPWKGRILLGEVRRQWWDNGYYKLEVRHFCGDPWPVNPCVSAVNVLERDGNSDFAS